MAGRAPPAQEALPRPTGQRRLDWRRPPGQGGAMLSTTRRAGGLVTWRRRGLAGLLTAIALSASAALAGDARPVDFDALVPEEASAADPLAGLSERALFDLSLALRMRDQGVDPAADTGRGRVLARLEASLAAAGVVVADVLARREAIAEARRAALTATEPTLEGERVSIAGFAVPAAEGREAGHFWLVPRFGMCSHVPLPPPNRMIRVTAPPGRYPARLHEPVAVTGRLAAEETAVVAFVGDGPVPMHAAWTLAADGIEPPGPERLAALFAEGGLPEGVVHGIRARFGGPPEDGPAR